MRYKKQIHELKKPSQRQIQHLLPYQIKNRQMLMNIENDFDERILNALLFTDREFFVPTAIKHSAFHLNPLPMSNEQWVSSPLTVAKMTSYLMSYDLKENVSEPDSVLEIGLGSGYQAVVLSHLIRRVFGIERIESLLLETRARIAQLEIMNINTKLDDGINGWEQYAPYDRILFSACTTNIPHTLLTQLNKRGVLVAPVYNKDKQVIVRIIKNENGDIKPEMLEECEFVPVLEGVVRNGNK